MILASSGGSSAGSVRYLTASIKRTITTTARFATAFCLMSPLCLTSPPVVSSAFAQTAAPSVEANPTAAAAELDPETRVLAREFAIRGAEAFDAGDYETALENFNRATAILDVPSIAVMQARTLVKLGRWLEGLDRLQVTARLQLGPNAPAPYREAVAQAAQEAEALRLQVPQVALLLGEESQGSEHALEVSFDEKPVPVALLNISRPVNPGRHFVRVRSHGTIYYENILDVTPSQQLQVQIPPPPRKTAPAPSPAAKRVVAPTEVAPPVSQPEQEPGASTKINWPLYGALGVTALGLAGTITATVLGSKHQSTLDEVCKPRCPTEYSDDVSALNTDRTVFYISAGVTALAGGVAAYLWLTEDDAPDQVGLRLSPGALSLVGRY